MNDTFGGAMRDVNRAVGELVKTVYRTSWRARDDRTRARIADVLKRAAKEIEQFTK
jgi:hypothetical protein